MLLSAWLPVTQRFIQLEQTQRESYHTSLRAKMNVYGYELGSVAASHCKCFHPTLPHTLFADNKNDAFFFYLI